MIWTRLLSLMLGPTVYTFSIILAVFLTGLGLGSSAGSVLARQSKKPAFGWVSASFCRWPASRGLHTFWPTSCPTWRGNVDTTYSPWRGFAGDMGRSALAILPAAILWGASFPLALASVAARQSRSRPG